LTRARKAAPDSIDDQIELARRRKDEALDAGGSETAARFRDQERRLDQERDRDLIGHVRGRLGLVPGEAPVPEDPPAPADQP
jgi:hypothetical protein